MTITSLVESSSGAYYCVCVCVCLCFCAHTDRQVIEPFTLLNQNGNTSRVGKTIPFNFFTFFPHLYWLLACRRVCLFRFLIPKRDSELPIDESAKNHFDVCHRCASVYAQRGARKKCMYVCVTYMYSHFTSVLSIPIKAMASNGCAKIANSAPSQHRQTILHTNKLI